VVTVLGIGVDVGLGSAVQKRVGNHQLSRVVSTVLSLKALFLLIIGTALLLGRGILEQFLSPSLVPFLIMAVGVQQLGRVGLHALRGELRVSEAAVVQLFGDLVLLTVGYIMAVLGFNLLGLIYAFVLQWILISVVALWLVGYVPRFPSVDVARSLFGFSKYTFVSSVVASALYGWMDTLLIGYFLSPGLVAVYEAAWRVARAVSLVSQSIGTALFPQVSDWQLRDNLSAVSETVREAISGALIIVFPAVVGATLFGDSLLGTFVDPSTAAGAMVLVILLVGKIPEGLNDVVARTLFGLDQPVYTAYSAGLFMIINAGLNIFLIPVYGIEGAAIGTTLAFGVNAFMNTYFLGCQVSIRFDYRTISYALLSSLSMGAILFVVDWIVPIDSPVLLLGTIVFGGLLYFGVLLIPPRNRQKAKTLKNQLTT
jgi:O-antigen/teichoic acid export membrane protein